MSEKLRLDLILVAKGLATSRSHAQELIEAQQVFLVEGDEKKVLKKASQLFASSSKIVVEQGPANRFVSRGGLKLEGALKHVQLSTKSLKAIDVGISTGGFSDCLLQMGAEFVLGIDVGHGQVHASLEQNPRLKFLEGINARALSRDEEVRRLVPAEKFDLVVMDVSFISISLILPELPVFLRPGGFLLSLVKPQFEVGVDGISKGGIVKDLSLYHLVEKRIKEDCESVGLRVRDYFASSIQGKDGNHEFFVFAEKV